MNKETRGQGWVVLGAGLAGLSAAYHLGPGARVFEAHARVGGECATDRIGKISLDRAGHLLHMRLPWVKRLVEKLLPGQWRAWERDARVRIEGREVHYPIQANTQGLPWELKAECLKDWLQAVTHRPQRAVRNFSEWSRFTFGESLARVFFEPYNRKLWTVPPRELTLDWMGAYVPKPELSRVIRGAFSDIREGGGYNARFWYPKAGGIGILPQALASRIPQLRLNSRAVAVDARKRTMTVSSQGRVEWKRLVSTLPLPELAKILDRPPAGVREAARALRANSVLVVNLAVRFPRPFHSGHWLYVPDPTVSFYRVGFPANYGTIAGQGVQVVTAEVALPPGTHRLNVRTAIERVRRDALALGILPEKTECVLEHAQWIRHAYVIFDSAHAAARARIFDYLEKNGIQSIGRWGGWEYSAMEDAIAAGARAAKA